MLSFTLSPIKILSAPDARNDYKIPMGDIIDMLNRAKSLYDTETYSWNNLRKYEPARVLKELFTEYNDPIYTNAYLKVVELIRYYNLINDDKKTIRHFDNASLPGTWVLAIHHIATTRNVRYEWLASSLLPTDDSKALPDTFHLYRHYPDNWMMSSRNNGDVTRPENQLDFESRCKGVDLYTSDIGFDADYFNQESQHSHANLGQIITGLLILNPGGNMITKQFTYFTSFTISLMAIMTDMFDRVDICKPLFSKKANSETYLVCIGFKNNFEIYRKRMFNRLARWRPLPLVTKNSLGDGFINSIIQSQTFFANSQIQQIQLMMAHNAPPSLEYYESMRVQLGEWVRLYRLPDLPRDRSLRIRRMVGGNKKNNRGKYRRNH